MMPVPWGMRNHCGEKLNSARAGGYPGGSGMISTDLLIRHVEYVRVSGIIIFFYRERAKRGMSG
jgi:hypothetical protein